MTALPYISVAWTGTNTTYIQSSYPAGGARRREEDGETEDVGRKAALRTCCLLLKSAGKEDVVELEYA